MEIDASAGAARADVDAFAVFDPALAGEFLPEVTGEGPWAHIDMAGPGFLTRSRGDYPSQQGGTGHGVRLIAELAGRLTP